MFDVFQEMGFQGDINTSRIGDLLRPLRSVEIIEKQKRLRSGKHDDQIMMATSACLPANRPQSILAQFISLFRPKGSPNIGGVVVVAKEGIPSLPGRYVSCICAADGGLMHGYTLSPQCPSFHQMAACRNELPASCLASAWEE
ncbi:efflux pump antibiotic resistance protein [Aspergillus luchuensis]|uniref:Efflux pump antibiotic resistance protein n=1 Tax=Aspergillus kawachii TaxID=1069201 RepID=A0A146F2R6_ASPKA|nr:efflux pump antibiotic resistance protein [Aspergillus luchuensis]